MTKEHEPAGSSQEDHGDIDFEQRRLERAVTDAASALDSEQIREALSNGLAKTDTHLTVELEPEAESTILDEHGHAKRGPSGRTREQIIASTHASFHLPPVSLKRARVRSALRARGIPNLSNSDSTKTEPQN